MGILDSISRDLRMINTICDHQEPHFNSVHAFFGQNIEMTDEIGFSHEIAHISKQTL